MTAASRRLDVQAGDTVLFGKYSGQEIKLDGSEFLIMREDEHPRRRRKLMSKFNQDVTRRTRHILEL